MVITAVSGVPKFKNFTVSVQIRLMTVNLRQFDPRNEKTCRRGFRLGQTQTRLIIIHRRQLET